jgi:4-amino-4-deoxy-L-arabinose transferase-like glycosyltransferase
LIKEYWTPEWDSAYFIEIARSLASGKGLTYLGYPPVKGSVGFVLLLSPIVRAFGLNFLVLNFFIVVCALVSLFFVFRLFNLFLAERFSLLITGFTAISYLVTERSTYIMSDIPYLFFSLLSLFLLNRFLSTQFSLRYGAAAGICLAFSIFIRPVALATFFGMLLYLAIAKNTRLKLKKISLVTILIIIPLAVWSLWPEQRSQKMDANLELLAEFTPYQQEYMRAEYDEPLSPHLNMRLFVARVIKNSIYYASQASSIVTGQRYNTSFEFLKSALRSIRTLVILGLIGFAALIIIIGFLRSLLTKRLLIDFYVLFYFGILLLIPAREPRYLLPLVPFVFYYFFEEIKTFYKKALRSKPESVSRIAFAVLLALVALPNLARDFKLVASIHSAPFYTTSTGSMHNKNFIDCIEWVKNNTSSDSRIISVQAPWVVLLAERWCVSFPWVNEEKIVLDFIKNIDACYIIVAPLIPDRQHYILPVIKNHEEEFREVYKSGDAKVYLINK